MPKTLLRKLKNSCTDATVAGLVLFFLAGALFAQDDTLKSGQDTILEVMSKSDVNYIIESPGKTIGGRSWDEVLEMNARRPIGQRFEFPMLVEEEGKKRVVPYPIKDEARGLFERAYKAFKALDYDEAEGLFRKVIEKDPGCYPAYLSLGNILHSKKDYAGAVDYYDKAIALNSIDYQCFAFKGSALLMLGRYEKAKQALIEALILSPSDNLTMYLLEKAGRKLGFRVYVKKFIPRALTYKENGKEVVVLVQKDDAEKGWAIYGMTRAVWMMEPVYRKEKTGSTDHNLTTIEEGDCLINLLAAYAIESAKKKEVKDSALERLKKIVENGDTAPFINFEIFGLKVPHFSALYLDEKERKEVKDYIEKYVLVGAAEKTGNKSSRDGKNQGGRQN